MYQTSCKRKKPSPWKSINTHRHTYIHTHTHTHTLPLNVDKYEVAVIKKGKVLKHLINGKSGIFTKLYFFLRADTVSSVEVKITEKPITGGKEMGPMQNQNFLSQSTFRPIKICFRATVIMLRFKVKKKIEKSSYFSKFLFERITKIGVMSMMGMKQRVQENR